MLSECPVGESLCCESFMVENMSSGLKITGKQRMKVGNKSQRYTRCQKRNKDASDVNLWVMLLFSRSVVSDSLWPHGLQYFRLLCPPPSPGVCSNSGPLSWWCYLSHPLSPPSPPVLRLSQHQGLFQEVALRIRWPEHWSFGFSVNPSSEYSRLISFRIDWFDLLAVQGTLKSLH